MSHTVYCGVSSMKEAANKKALESRALYLQFFGLSLSQAVSNTLKEVKVMQDSLDIALEICKLLKFSPQRDAFCQMLKQELSLQALGLHNLRPTRWTVHALPSLSAFDSTMRLASPWEEAVSIVQDSEVKARISWVAAMMNFSNFLSGLMLAETILKNTDNLSKTLQYSAMSAVEAHSISQMSIGVLQKIRTDLCFDQLWALVQMIQQSLRVSKPLMSTHHRRQRPYEDFVAEPHRLEQVIQY